MRFRKCAVRVTPFPCWKIACSATTWRLWRSWRYRRAQTPQFTLLRIINRQRRKCAEVNIWLIDDFWFDRKSTSPSVKRWRRRLSSPHQTLSPHWRTSATTSSATTRPWGSVGRTPGLSSSLSARAWPLLSWLILDSRSIFCTLTGPASVSVIYLDLVINISSIQMLQNAQTSFWMCYIRKWASSLEIEPQMSKYCFLLLWFMLNYSFRTNELHLESGF